jgi:hypothetical protein
VAREEEIEQSAQKTLTGRSDLKEHRRVDGPGIEDEASDLYSVHIRNGKSSVPVLRHEGSVAEAEDGSVGIENVDGGLELVDARGEDEIFAESERKVNLSHGIGGLGDEEVCDGFGDASAEGAGPADVS